MERMLEKKIMDFLKRFFRVDTLGFDDNIFEMGYVNSLFSMQLVMFLEKEFDIEIEPEDMNLDNIVTVNKIVKFLNSKGVM
jgi:acyl carrier protein